MNKHFDKTQCGQKGISTLILIIIIIAVAIVAVGGVLAYQYFSPKVQPVVQTQQNQNCVPEGGQYGAPRTAADLCCTGLVEKPTTNSGTVGVCVKPADQHTGWITYTNTQYGYQIKLPSDWTGYRVVNAKTTQLFQLPTNNKTWYETDANGNKVYGYGTVFMIDAYSLADWNKMKADCATQWDRGCYKDEDALGRTSTNFFVSNRPTSGPSVGGDLNWGILAHEVGDSNYLKNNFSIIAP